MDDVAAAQIKDIISGVWSADERFLFQAHHADADVRLH